MYIVQVTSEVAPIAKVGGLADVMMGLSRELHKANHQVEIYLPKYASIPVSSLKISEPKSSFTTVYAKKQVLNHLVKAKFNGDFDLFLVEAGHPDNFFDRKEIYGYSDDADRFLFFCRSVLDYLKAQEKIPDIIHLHDWETAPIALLLLTDEYKKYFKNCRVVLTIHNLEYQGWSHIEALERASLYSSQFNAKENLQEGSYVNLLKGGIVYSDFITTVSKNYAKEVLTTEGGRGLEEILKRYNHKFCGIINGIDYTYWNPETDPFIPYRFSKTTPKNLFINKRKNKKALLQELGVKNVEEKPLIISVARLVPQKGIALIKQAITRPNPSYYFVLLGSSQDPAVTVEFEELYKQLSDEGRAHIILKNEEALAHRLYAASDICLVPSLFEPCGLVQLIALRYGSIPIVRLTGGLLDTIHEGINGFVFNNPETDELDCVLDRSLNLWYNDPQKWKDLVDRAINQDFSWKIPAQEYIQIYKKVKAHDPK